MIYLVLKMKTQGIIIAILLIATIAGISMVSLLFMQSQKHEPSSLEEQTMQVETDKDYYLAGQEIEVTAKNISEKTVWILNSVTGCIGTSFFFLQEKTENDWREKNIDYGVCDEEQTFKLVPLSPGEQINRNIFLSREVFAKGEHTYRISVPYWEEKPFEGITHDYQKVAELINKAPKAYSKEFIIESNIVKTCSSDADCSWVSTNCCPENAGAHWECINAKLSKLDCVPKGKVCPQVISPMPEIACVCENGFCTAK